VLDPDGLAWQRLEGNEHWPSVWQPARPGLLLNSGACTWSTLLINKRELRLIYDADLTVQFPDLGPPSNLVAQLDDPPPR